MNYFDRTCIARIGLRDLTWLTVEGLHMAFEVEKTSTRTCNTASLDIWNLSKGTRDKIHSDGLSLEILAGYEEAGGPKMIFKGDITYSNPGQRKGGSGKSRGEVLSRRQGPDIITHLEAADGDRALRETLVEMSYKEGSTPRMVLEGLVNAFKLKGLSARDVPGLLGKIYHKGFSFSGLAADCLDKLCNGFDLEWSVQNNVLQILQRRLDNGSEVVLLSPGTGLIGSPERILDYRGCLKDEDDPTQEVQPMRVYILKPRRVLKGWKVPALLQPLIEPGGRVMLQCADIPEATLFRVWEVKHKGDTHDQGPFTTTPILTEIEAA